MSLKNAKHVNLEIGLKFDKQLQIHNDEFKLKIYKMKEEYNNLSNKYINSKNDYEFKINCLTKDFNKSEN